MPDTGVLAPVGCLVTAAVALTMMHGLPDVGTVLNPGLIEEALVVAAPGIGLALTLFDD